MAAIINKDVKLSEAQQKEIVEQCNEAYDKGGADVLRIIAETVQQIAVDNESMTEHVAFTLYILEAIRQRLSEVVHTEEHDTLPEPSLILS
jgi:hypothetical protein